MGQRALHGCALHCCPGMRCSMAGWVGVCATGGYTLCCPLVPLLCLCPMPMPVLAPLTRVSLCARVLRLEDGCKLRAPLTGGQSPLPARQARVSGQKFDHLGHVLRSGRRAAVMVGWWHEGTLFQCPHDSRWRRQ